MLWLAYTTCYATTIVQCAFSQQVLCRFHAQRFYAIECLTTKEPNATHVKTDMTLNMMLINMPVANAADFYHNVQVRRICTQYQWRCMCRL